MILLRKILFPFAVLYGWITWFRNFMYDKGISKSHRFELPVIAVGNLSVGGTGKTPMIEYLIRLLSSNYQVAALSRGYKRTSQGFVLADECATPESIGDEPFQFHRKFPDIKVAVDVNRKNGIMQLLAQSQKPQVILLDDAFQHRKVQAGFYILLTAYGDLLSDDFMLPTGNLREPRAGAKRADIIIVTKCPVDLSSDAQNEIRQNFRISAQQHLYFTAIEYEESVYSENDIRKVDEIRNMPKLLVAGIAKPKLFFNYLRADKDAILEFPDHHNFSNADILNIQNKASGKIIVTTEKDYVRLKSKLGSIQLFYLPIKTSFLANAKNFDNTISNYVGKSTTNS